MSDILNIRGSAEFDDTITSKQFHSYNPYTTSFNNCDEIRIAIQQQDLYLLPHDSYIYIEGKIEKDSTANSTDQCPALPNNAPAFLFDEIRYELNGFEIDKCKNVGITTSMKGYVSFEPNDMRRLEIAGWKIDKKTKPTVPGYINYCIPLKILFGFAEDYQNIIINAKHELILIRSRSDTNAFCREQNILKFVLNKVQWRIPHIQVSDTEKLNLLRFVEKNKSIQLTYRSWELDEHSALPENDKNIWSVKTSLQVNTPRYIVIGFQTNRNNQIKMDKSVFDHCEISDLKVFLNSVCYPYENLNLDFAKNQYAVLYDMYARFQECYYHDKFHSQPLLSFADFKSIAPLIVIDCSRQNESLKKSVVDIRIEMQTKNTIPPQTTAYCLIVHDNILSYNPYTNSVNRMI